MGSFLFSLQAQAYDFEAGDGETGEVGEDMRMSGDFQPILWYGDKVVLEGLGRNFTDTRWTMTHWGMEIDTMGALGQAIAEKPQVDELIFGGGTLGAYEASLDAESGVGFIFFFGTPGVSRDWDHVSISFNNNQFSETGVEALVRALLQGGSYRKLTLSFGGELSQEQEAGLQAVIAEGGLHVARPQS